VTLHEANAIVRFAGDVLMLLLGICCLVALATIIFKTIREKG
jgi:hypothetical protein